MKQDWTGNTMSLFTTNGDTSHGNERRDENDYYATPPEAVRMLCEIESFDKNILEPCAGGGHIVNELLKSGYSVKSNDLFDYGFKCDSNVDFITGIKQWFGDIITNPPYKFAMEFVEHALEIIPDGNKVAMFMKLSFLEGKGRKRLFENYPPQFVYVSRSRLNCGKNGVFTGTSAVCYCWFIWTKGFKGNPQIKWFN